MVIYGLIGAMSTMYAQHVDPETAFKAMANEDGDDLFAWNNPIWAKAGVVTPTGSDSGNVSTRNSFPAAGPRPASSKRSWSFAATQSTDTPSSGDPGSALSQIEEAYRNRLPGVSRDSSANNRS